MSVITITHFDVQNLTTLTQCRVTTIRDEFCLGTYFIQKYPILIQQKCALVLCCALENRQFHQPLVTALN
jgi:hypothetical protein